MVKNVKTWISWERNITFWQNKKDLNLCLKWNILRSYHFVVELTFKCHIQRLEKINWISKCVTLCWIFWKKVIKIKYSRSLLDHESSGCGHSEPYKFFSVFADFRTLVDNSVKPKLVDSTQKNFAVTGDRNFQLPPKNRVLEPIEKKSVDCYVYSTILVITKSYIFLLYFTSVLLFIMRSQPDLIVWTVTSTVEFYHCWSYTEHFVIWIRYLVYIWY